MSSEPQDVNRARCLLAVNHKLRNIVGSKLMSDWSPEQISGWIKARYPDDESLRVSHKTIYRSLFIQVRGVRKKELMEPPSVQAAHAPLFLALDDRNVSD